MDKMLGILKVRVRRGINLAVRDFDTSDPYVVITMAEQRLKSKVVKKNCNPQWNEELTLSIKDPNVPIKLTVYDKDTFTGDDKMGEAMIEIKPYLESLDMGLNLEDLPPGTKLDRVQPSKNNCLSEESCIVWDNGKVVQDMRLKLKNVERGEVVVQIEFIDHLGRSGFRS
ncbi:protein C2-DOMAIN ABA-RELATED 10-like [Cornus florida]|uniref:protein C2-DOMAIN ABA-RELATED 10-like n=1 Tax=Cornus florida TaxID=4283 RepID=UPI002896ADAD|nr:protein C2-DOMAIN ABA-RELATED 10-like [Cornus florida]